MTPCTCHLYGVTPNADGSGHCMGCWRDACEHPRGEWRPDGSIFRCGRCGFDIAREQMPPERRPATEARSCAFNEGEPCARDCRTCWAGPGASVTGTEGR